MATSKLKARLAQLEQQYAFNLAAKEAAINFVRIPAMPDETDQEAISKRLGTPVYEHYRIAVLRRDGNGIKCTRYDQEFNLYSPSNKIFHPDDPECNYTYSSLFNKVDAELLWSLYNKVLTEVEES